MQVRRGGYLLMLLLRRCSSSLSFQTFLAAALRGGVFTSSLLLSHQQIHVLICYLFPHRHTETTRDAIESMFTRLIDRGDVGLIIINAAIAEQIRGTIAAHTDTVPMVLEIPSGSSTTDLQKDPLLKRVLQMLGEA